MFKLALKNECFLFLFLMTIDSFLHCFINLYSSQKSFNTKSMYNRLVYRSADLGRLAMEIRLCRKQLSVIGFFPGTPG